MSRQQFTFRPSRNNAEYQQAWRILLAVPEGRRNGYIARAILEMEARSDLETMLRRVLKDELRSVTLVETDKEKPKQEKQIPKQMTDFLAGFMNQ